MTTEPIVEPTPKVAVCGDLAFEFSARALFDGRGALVLKGADAGGAVHLGIDNPGAGRDGGVAGSVPLGGDRPPTLQFTCPPPRRWRRGV